MKSRTHDRRCDAVADALLGRDASGYDRFNLLLMLGLLDGDVEVIDAAENIVLQTPDAEIRRKIALAFDAKAKGKNVLHALAEADRDAPRDRE